MARRAPQTPARAALAKRAVLQATRTMTERWRGVDAVRLRTRDPRPASLDDRDAERRSRRTARSTRFARGLMASINRSGAAFGRLAEPPDLTAHLFADGVDASAPDRPRCGQARSRELANGRDVALEHGDVVLDRADIGFYAGEALVELRHRLSTARQVPTGQPSNGRRAACKLSLGAPRRGSCLVSAAQSFGCAPQGC